MHEYTTNVPRARSGVVNDLTPTPTSKLNSGLMNVSNLNPDLSTTNNIQQYLRAFYTPRPYFVVGSTPLADLKAQNNVLAAMLLPQILVCSQ